jgi:hypothetical protein
VLKTTLYLPRSLAGAVKQYGATAGLSVNAIVLEALARLLSAETASGTGEGAGGPSPMPDREGTARPPAPPVVDAGAIERLRQELARLNERVSRLEQADHRPDHHVASRVERPRPSGTVGAATVRQVMRDVILERGEPIPHREAVRILTVEKGLILPGLDRSENLRTILVHPKASGFVNLKPHGYWVDDKPHQRTGYEPKKGPLPRAL